MADGAAGMDREFRTGQTVDLDPWTTPLDSIDLTDPELWRQEKYWAFFERLRREDPVHLCPASDHGPFWSVTRYDDIFYVDTHHELFSSEPGIVVADMDDDFQLPMFIAMDPPKHDAQRKAVSPIVGREMLDKIEPMIRERVQQILDGLPVGAPFNWVDKVSIELTGQMLATLFDMPFEDRRRLTRWSDVATGRGNPDIVPGGDEQWRAELLECAGYFQGLWDVRKAQPRGYDLISLMAHDPATSDMPYMEFLGNLILLIVGGNDTTRNSLTGGVLALNQYPEQFARLKADPSVIPNMVAEIIRWQTPLAHMRRLAKEDTVLGGKQIKAGDKVVMWYASGNRDESVFERPNELWIDRPNPRRHLSFGYGIHRCVGMRVGEMQIRITWEELLKRFSHVEVVGEPVRIPSSFVKGYSDLQVVLHAK
jgi:cytochrome P450